MKKLFSYIVLSLGLLTTLLFVGCDKTTIQTPKTIILHVTTTEEDLNFSANFGEGTYDSQTKTYTHNIDYIKDLYIYINAPHKSTKTVLISTQDMSDDTIIRDVTFGEELDARVELTFKGVKDLSALKCKDENPNYTYEIVNQKILVSLPNRTDDYCLNFELEGYKDIVIQIDKQSLANGLFTMEKTILKVNEYSLTVSSDAGFGYDIYSLKDDTLKYTGYVYEFLGEKCEKEFVFEKDGTQYYLEVNNRFYKITPNQDTHIKLKTTSSYLYENIYIKNYDNSNFNVQMFAFNFADNAFHQVGNSYDENEYENRLYIPNNYQDLWFFKFNYNTNQLYCFTNPIIETDENNEKVIDCSESKFTLMNGVDVTTYDTITGGEIDARDSTIDYSTFASGGILSIAIQDNVLKLEKSMVRSDSLLYNLVSSIDGSLLEQASTYISPYSKEEFTGKRCSGTVTVDNRSFRYSFVVFAEDIEWDASRDAYVLKSPNREVNLEKILISISLRSSDGSYYFDLANSNGYLLDEDENTIEAQNGYFEVELGKKYYACHDYKTYEFVVTDEIVQAGQVTLEY